MVIFDARFLVSNTDHSKCPSPDIPEYAFIGRSNVGKSSLINMITGSKNLAKISGTPGKTRLINHFIINGNWYIVDLPGYGFAKISRETRIKWKKILNDYLLHRTNLITTFILIDFRLIPQKSDLEFIQWLGENNLPFVILFTKTDKLSRSQQLSNLKAYKQVLTDQWEELPLTIVTSSRNGTGKEEILQYIDEMNQLKRKATN